MTKHTPGPWFVDGAKPWQIILRTEKTNMLRIASANTQFTRTYAANARLMAAAPELLEALKNATSVLKAFAGHVKDGIADVTLEQARAAIAKAEGA